MKITKTNIENLIIIEPKYFEDERGYFTETYNKNAFKEIGIVDEFVQDNESKSKQGVLRGMHFQTHNPQGKLVRCTKGRIWDVAVDLRNESKTFGQWFALELSEENKKTFYIPPRFAHGFLVLSDEAIFSYKCTKLYDPSSDSGIAYNSKELNIVWPKLECELIISDKDKKHTLGINYIKWT